MTFHQNHRVRTTFSISMCRETFARKMGEKAQFASA